MEFNTLEYNIMTKRALILLVAVVVAVVIAVTAAPESSTAGTFDDIVAKRKITIGVKYDFPPFGYLDDKGELSGFDLRVASYIADKLGVTPEFKKVTSMDRIGTLLGGDIDVVIASMTKTPNRAKIVGFTDTYFVDGQGMLSSSRSLIKDEKDLDGKIIAVIMGSTGERYISSNLIEFKALSLFHNYVDALDALTEGKVDVIVTDYSWCSSQEKSSGGSLKAVGKSLTTEPFGMAVRKEDEKLLQKLNELLAEMWKDGAYKEAYWEFVGKEPDFDLAERSGG